MSQPEQREIAETVFEQRREEIKDAMKLEDERRATLVKNLYRLRALRLSLPKQNDHRGRAKSVSLIDTGAQG
jgi:hypothetical protein